MICIIALVVFGILGIFSATHRTLAKEAFNCVFKRATLRKCTTGFDVKIKSQITGYILTKNETFAKLVYKYFEILSWLFIIISVISIILVAQTAYNIMVYGTCNPEDPGSCIITNYQTKEECLQDSCTECIGESNESGEV
jgi:hypothetical protein